MISVIKQRKIWFSFSAAMVLCSLLAVLFFGLRLGIDFTGGSLLEVEFTAERPEKETVIQVLDEFDLGNIVVQPVGQQGMILRFRSINENTHQEILTALKKNFSPPDLLEKEVLEKEISIDSDEIEVIIDDLPDMEKVIDYRGAILEKRFDSIGPIIGSELKKKTIYAILIVLLAIIAFIAFAFRKVSKPIASWKYGIIAVITLAHDIIITVGIFALLGTFYNTEANAPFVAALLTILGYSVNDTIVIFDRIRENLVKMSRLEFSEIINHSINETLSRSINTMLTTLLALIAVFLFGGVTIKFFVLALIFGIFSGTYSSIFIASPLLVLWEKFSHKK